MKTTVVISNLILASVLMLGACSDKQDTGTSTSSDNVALNDTQKRLASVETGTLEYRVLSPAVSCTGEIEVPPRGMASVTAPLGGYIADTDMIPGQAVRKGQLLARLTNPEYVVLQQSYLETSGQLRFAEQELERQKLLEKQNATAGKKLQESESLYAVLKARMAGLKAQLDLVGVDVKKLEKGVIQKIVYLRSPISGYVTAVNHHPGEYVEPREAIFEIVNLSDLHLHLSVFEQDIARVNIGQPVRFRLTSGGDKWYEGEVSLVSPKRDMGQTSFDVHGHIRSHAEELKPGMYLEAEILISNDTLPALPEDAIVHLENIPHVVVYERDHYILKQVSTGVRMDGWVEIKDPAVLEDKQVVIRGASRLSAALQRE